VLATTVPDVAVTVNVAAPLGVPGTIVFVVPEPTTPQPVIVSANTSMAKPTPAASRGSGNFPRQIAAAESSADRIAKIQRNSIGLAPRYGPAGSSFDAAVVEKLSRTVVPVGGDAGVTELDGNWQDVLAGRPEHDKVNVRFDPGAPNSVSEIGRLCPAATTRFAGGAAKPITFSVTEAELLEAKFASAGVA